MSNPPKPVERKRRTGNPGKKRLPKLSEVAVLPAVVGVPNPLRPLQSAGLDLWQRTWATGAVWLSPNTDMDLVQLVCETLDERQAVREFVLSGEADWRDRVALRNLDDQIKSMLSALGMTPTDRTRLGVAEVQRVSKLDELRARAAQR